MKAIGILLFFSIAPLLAASPAIARYDCVVVEEQGYPAGRSDRITATVSEGGAVPRNQQVHIQRLIELGVLDPKRYSRRFFVIDYWGAREGPWIATHAGFNFPVHVKPPNRPLFVSLILDRGEHIDWLVMDADGTSKYSPKAVFSPGAPPPQVTASQSVYRSSEGGEAFLDSLAEATSMTIELKYSDGETLARDRFDVSRPGIVQRTVDSALEMHEKHKDQCKLTEEQVEF